MCDLLTTDPIHVLSAFLIIESPLRTTIRTNFPLRSTHTRLLLHPTLKFVESFGRKGAYELPVAISPSGRDPEAACLVWCGGDHDGGECGAEKYGSGLRVVPLSTLNFHAQSSQLFYLVGG